MNFNNLGAELRRLNQNVLSVCSFVACIQMTILAHRNAAFDHIISYCVLKSVQAVVKLQAAHVAKESFALLCAALCPLLGRKACLMQQAERPQQYRVTVAQESEAALASASLRAHSNLEQIVDQMSQEEEAQQDHQARSVSLPAAAAALRMHVRKLSLATSSWMSCSATCSME